MTNKEAQNLIARNRSVFQHDTEMLEALDIAIKALEERPQGKWIHSYDDFYVCSLCGRGICTDWETEPYKHYPFCHCGADMRGDV